MYNVVLHLVDRNLVTMKFVWDNGTNSHSFSLLKCTTFLLLRLSSNCIRYATSPISSPTVCGPCHGAFLTTGSHRNTDK